MHHHTPRIASLVAIVVWLAVLSPAPSSAQDPASVAVGRRVADIVDIAVAEYSEGVIDGRVVLLEELNEARLFLSGARRTAEDLPAELAAGVRPYLDRLSQLIEELAAEELVREQLAGLRSVLEAGLGVSLDPMPERPPSLTRGASLYTKNCAQCHGSGGAGDGVLSIGMEPPPSDLTDRALRTVPPVEFFRKINVGVAGTAMPGFVDSLNLDDRWALALYASTLRYSVPLRDRGASLFATGCAECRMHLSDLGTTALVNDDSLATLIIGYASGPLEAADLEAMVAYGRAAGAGDELGADRGLIAVRTVAQTKAGVERALAFAERGEHGAAAQMALDAYLEFERIESAVRARDAAAARAVELGFAELRGSLQRGDDAERLAAARGSVFAALDRAVERLTVTASPSVLLGQSFVIIVREGLEAILIIGALMAFLTKAGAAERRRDVGLGVLVAVVASLATAAGFATLFRNAVAHREVIEGVTMLIAAVVLFWVSYWLVSKIELRKWQAFVRGKMESALSSQRSWALGGVAFLAVYREGFETVLFYAALFTSSDGSLASTGGILTGIVIGSIVLGFVYFAMQRYGLRLPLKPFFAVTSAFLYLMAFSFAGQGVAELQEIGWIGTTSLDWLPAIPALGIFPTMQTLASQLVLAFALVGALMWVFWLQPKAARAGA